MSQPLSYSGHMIALDAGAAYHHFTFTDPALSPFFDEVVYLDDLTEAHLQRADAVLVPCRTPAHRLLPWRDDLLRFAEQGGLLVVMGETQPDSWLMPLPTEPVATNYWWWLTAEDGPELQPADDNHDLFQYVAFADCRWHLHALHTLPEGFCSILNHRSGQSVLLEGPLGREGYLILTSLDPMYHHGSFFMPATTAFLGGFLPWVRKRLNQQIEGALQHDDTATDCSGK
ncbi:MAG: hypothetical protein ABJ000_15950 [Saccharospirillum sp.]|uniref:hypothetical protein n=1 Tax=Saccharospirillum sp. TaxID=2033801 RepID=UPI0032988CC3